MYQKDKLFVTCWNAFPAPNQPARLFGFCRLGLFHWHLGTGGTLALARKNMSIDAGWW